MSVALLGFWRRWLLILTLAAAAAGAVAAYSFTVAKHYEATALLVVSPVSASDPTFLGIDVFRESQRRTAAETAARLIRSPEIADTVRVRLGLRRSTADVLGDVSTRVLGGSDAVAVTATDTAPTRAAQLANAFVDAFVAARTSAFQSEVVSAVARLQKRLVAMSPNERIGPAGAQLQRRLADTRALVSMRDPTVTAGSQAVQPRSASWPEPVRWTIYAALAGLGAGCLVALALALASALRRREPLMTASVGDRGESEALVDRLEQRLAERVNALADAQMRVAGREAALEVREQEIRAKLEELRKATVARPPEQEQAAVEPGRLEELELREQTLASRVEAVEERERELAQRGAELHRVEVGLDDRRAAAERDERELAARTEELAAREESLAARAQELAGKEALVAREPELAAREESLAAREQELVARGADLATRESGLVARENELVSREERLAARAKELEQEKARLADERAVTAAREEELAARVAELAAQPPLLAATPPAPPSGPAVEPWLPEEPAPPLHVYTRGAWRLEELERLVERESPSNPDRAEEWRSYLFYLREYADADGRVPSQFDWLIEDAFGELLAHR